MKTARGPARTQARATGAETPGRFAGRPRAAAPAEPIRDSGLRQQGRIGKNPRGERGQADADVSVGNFEKRGKGRALGRVPVVLGILLLLRLDVGAGGRVCFASQPATSTSGGRPARGRGGDCCRHRGAGGRRRLPPARGSAVLDAGLGGLIQKTRMSMCRRAERGRPRAVVVGSCRGCGMEMFGGGGRSVATVSR